MCSMAFTLIKGLRLIALLYKIQDRWRSLKWEKIQWQNVPCRLKGMSSPPVGQKLVDARNTDTKSRTVSNCHWYITYGEETIMCFNSSPYQKTSKFCFSKRCAPTSWFHHPALNHPYNVIFFILQCVGFQRHGIIIFGGFSAILGFLWWTPTI